MIVEVLNINESLDQVNIRHVSLKPKFDLSL